MLWRGQEGSDPAGRRCVWRGLPAPPGGVAAGVTPPSEWSSLARRAVHLPSMVGLVLPGRLQLGGDGGSRQRPGAPAAVPPPSTADAAGSLGRQTLLCPPSSQGGDGRRRQKGMHDSRYQRRFCCWPPATKGSGERQFQRKAGNWVSCSSCRPTLGASPPRETVGLSQSSHFWSHKSNSCHTLSPFSLHSMSLAQLVSDWRGWQT